MAILPNMKYSWENLVNLCEDYQNSGTAHVKVSDISNQILYANNEIKVLVKLIKKIDEYADRYYEDVLSEEERLTFIKVLKEDE